jgi:hypothetical protein
VILVAATGKDAQIKKKHGGTEGTENEFIR